MGPRAQRILGRPGGTTRGDAGRLMVGSGGEDGGTLGQMLRARREARGLTQEQAAQQARVQIVFVRALEDDDYRLLPDELYLSRFVFEYATFLTLDPAVADAAFRRQFRRAASHSPLYRAVPRLAALPWRRLLWTTGVILALIPLAFILVSLLGRERDTPPTPAPAPAARADEPTGLPGPPAGSGGGPPVAAPEPAVPGQTWGVSPAGGGGTGATSRHILMVRAHELTWLAVRVDGGDEHEVLLREGEMVRWGAGQGFLLTVGNAGGVDLLLDGQPVSVPGRRGEVIRNLQLPPAAKPSP